ncbi:P-loop containing nucleoside triphosphate hydrolase protein [Favolaschia claudopus]|uniref:DNA 3'-5' helicase n=1 Tax=Favolaschia claudopus TaxID=2862362 RepID=A0AAW0C4H8_9AGAR
MDTPEVQFDAEAAQLLQEIRISPLEELKSLASSFLTLDAPLVEYLESLVDKHKTIALKACLIVQIISRYRIIPRKFQLEAVLALDEGRDVILESGTGSGKTLCLIIPNLLYPDTTSITISPLKRLQILQASELERWGIRTVCINEDTPSDKALWTKITSGYFQHIITQPEQLRIHNGHLPRLAKLLNDRHFVCTVSRVNVDEAHFIYTAGLPLYGVPAFRPSWGALNLLRLRLGKGTPLLAMSATLPPHIKCAVVRNLNFDPSTMLSLELPTSRPNIIYSTHRIVGSLSEYRNLDFLVSETPRKTLVFHDNTQQCSDSRAHQNKLLSTDIQKNGLIQHYHAGMSKAYLKQVFDDFAKEDGACEILHTTEGLSTGLHVADVDVVVDYGAPRAMPTVIQRGGRAGRRGQLSVYLLMAEPWVYTASLDAVDSSSDDPDRPISGRLIKNSKKPERAGLAVVLYVRSSTCLREMFARYLNDRSRDALKITTDWCCDQPHDTEIQFDKRSFFPGRFIYEEKDGKIYAGDVDEPDRIHLNPPKAKKPKGKGKKNRKVADRVPLQDQLNDWLSSAHTTDPLRAVRPPTFILDAKSIKSLSTVHPDRMRSPDDVTSTLDETPEWAEEWASKVFYGTLRFSGYGKNREPSIIDAFSRRATMPQRKVGGKKKPRKATELEADVEWEPPAKRQRKGAPLVEVSTNVRRSSRLNK